MVSPPDLSEQFFDPPLLSSRRLGWEGLVVERYRHLPGELHLSPVSEHVVSLYLGQPLRSVQWQDGHNHEGLTVRGDVAVKAAGRSHGWRWETAVELVHVRLRPELLLRVAEENGLDSRRADLVGSYYAPDPHLAGIGGALLAELAAGGANGRLRREALAQDLAARLLSRNGAPARSIGGYDGRLPRAALRRAVEYVGDDLGGDLSLAGLAGAAGMSPYHFARLFKRSTGLSPHQYVVRRRVDEARRMLAYGSLSVAEVAQAVGFYDQSHLTRHTRRLLGVTPGALQRR